MPVVKATVLSIRRKLRVQTDGGTRLEYELIPHVGVGDEVWVFTNVWGEVQKIEPHSCEHGDTPLAGEEIQAPIHIDHSGLDSVT